MEFQKFPQSKDVAGPAFWNVIYNVASQYPYNPTRSDKLTTSELLKGLMNRFTCSDCVSHANDYLKEHPLNMKGKIELVDSLCQMQNSIRRRQGKREFDCSSILDPEYLKKSGSEYVCPSCQIKHTEAAAAYDPVVENIESIKSSYERMAEKLALEHNVPKPQIVWDVCPIAPGTSCTAYDRDKVDFEGRYTGSNPVIYMNPNNASMRVFFHEFDHYVDVISNKVHSISEMKANEYAYSKMNKYFNNGVGSKSATTTNIAAATDNMSLTENNTSIYSWKQRYPMYQQIENGQFGTPYAMPAVAAGGNTAQPVAVEQMTNPILPPDPNSIVHADDGIIKAFEPIARLPAKWIGVTPYDFAMTYVPEVINTTVRHMLAANTTHFGSWLISLLGGVGMFVGGVLLRKNMGYGDRLFLQNITASLISNIASVSNPKVRDGVVNGMLNFSNGIMNGDLDGIYKSIVEFPENGLIAKWMGKGVNNKTDEELLGLGAYATDINDSFGQDLTSPVPLKSVKTSVPAGMMGTGNGLDAVYQGQSGSIMGDDYISEASLY